MFIWLRFPVNSKCTYVWSTKTIAPPLSARQVSSCFVNDSINTHETICKFRFIKEWFRSAAPNDSFVVKPSSEPTRILRLKIKQFIAPPQEELRGFLQTLHSIGILKDPIGAQKVGPGRVKPPIARTRWHFIFWCVLITMRFYVPQNAQNEVRYVPCCDTEEGSDT
jgi:hypothetical protein